MRENGGQYTHGCIWSIFAWAKLGDGDKAWELFDFFNPISHSSSHADAAHFKVEPYVSCADVYSVGSLAGRGGWTWYSGSAGWLYRADNAAPYDRTNLSKGVLSGDIAEDANDLHPPDFYRDNRIDLRLGSRVERIHPTDREVELAGDVRVAYQTLLIATGAEPVKLDVPGAPLPHVHYLRSAADSHRLIRRARQAKRAVIIGASFIGLEVASGLRARGIEVLVVGRDTSLLPNVLGKELEGFCRRSTKTTA